MGKNSEDSLINYIIDTSCINRLDITRKVVSELRNDISLMPYQVFTELNVRTAERSSFVNIL